METTSLTFGSPLWFWALAVVPVLAALYYWSQRRSNAAIASIVAPRLRQQLASAVSVFRRTLRAALVLGALALIFVALAQPQKGYIEQQIRQKGRDVVFVFDTSRSMLSTDAAPTRLVRAKLLAEDLMNLIHGDRVGVVAFAGNAFVQAPLTLDYGAVLQTIDDLDTKVIPLGGTNIAAGIDSAVEALGSATEAKTQAIVLMTDGEDLDANGVAAAERAAKKGIRIFTVGIGSADGSLIPIKTDDGQQDFVRDDNGKPVLSRLDEARLKEIAQATGGFYMHLGADTAQVIYDKGIAPMSKEEKGTFSSKTPIERYQWPTGAAIALMIAWMLIGERKWQPKAVRRPARAAAQAAALMLALACTARAADSGYEEYQKGKYDRAMADFQQRLQADPSSDKLQFDAGAAAYKLGDYKQAVDHFTRALLSNDPAVREAASYSLANSLVRRGEASEAKDDKKSDWKNAIEQYTEALKTDPKDAHAQENREIVKKLLEDLDKQEKQQQQQQQNKDQQQNKQDQKQQQQQNQNNQQQQQNKDQKDQGQNSRQQQNQQQSGQQNKDQQQQGDQKQQQNQQSQGQQNQQQSQSGSQQKEQSGNQQQQQNNQGQQNKDQQQSQNQRGQNQQGQQQQQSAQNGAAPTPTPGPAKQGQISASGSEKQNGDASPTPAQMAQAEEGKDGKMTSEQARALLNSSRSDDAKVYFNPRDQQDQPIKDW